MRWLIGISVAIAIGLGTWLGFSNFDSRSQLDVGQSFSYSINYQSLGGGDLKSFTTSNTSDLTQNIQTDLEGHLILTLESSYPEENVFGFIIVPKTLSLNFNGRQLANPKDALNGQIVTDGELYIKEFRANTAVHAKYGFILADIFSLMDFGQIKERKSEWLRDEASIIGSFPTQWTREKKDSRIELSKTYLPSQNRDIRLAGKASISIDARTGMPIEVNAQRDREYLSAGEAYGKDNTFFKMKKSEPLNIKTDPSERGQLISENLKGTKAREIMTVEVYRQELGNMTADELRTSLQELQVSGSMDLIPIFKKLKAYIALNPKDLKWIQDELLRLDRNDPKFGALAAAMTAIGSPEAQDSLRLLIRDYSDDVRKNQQLIPNLSFTAVPTVETEIFIETLARESPEKAIQSTASLAIGTIGNRLKTADPSRAEKIYQDTLSQLQQKNPETELALISRLGNMGYSKQTEIIKPYTESSDEKIRKNSVMALRFVESPEAMNIILNKLENDPSPVVRESAAEALTYSVQPGDLEILESVLVNEKSVGTIKNVIMHLHQMSSLDPRAKDLIIRFSQQCGHPDLCGFVKSILKAR